MAILFEEIEKDSKKMKKFYEKLTLLPGEPENIIRYIREMGLLYQTPSSFPFSERIRNYLEHYGINRVGYIHHIRCLIGYFYPLAHSRRIWSLEQELFTIDEALCEIISHDHPYAYASLVPTKTPAIDQAIDFYSQSLKESEVCWSI